jgi:hypothetical protein
VEFATLEWVDRFDHRRLFGPIGHVPPAEAEARHYEQLEDVAMAAQDPNDIASGKPGAVHFDLWGRHGGTVRADHDISAHITPRLTTR